MGGSIAGLSVYDFPDVAKEILRKFSRDNLNEFDPYLQKEDESKIDCNTKPLMPHQALAIKNWRSANKRGILKHATGSGKTITAISAIKAHMSEGKPVLIVVPSKLLLVQWHEEIKSELGDVFALRCGAGHNAWRKNNNLKQVMQNGSSGDVGAIIIAVNDTASSDEFLNGIANLHNCLLVSDEVHSGSKQNSRIQEKDFAYRLGLSATPERYRDPDGTHRIFEFFQGIVAPEVTLVDAMKSGRLVPYDYFPILTYLDAEEQARWGEITRKIINYIRLNDIDKNNFDGDGQLSLMLINRSRIAKKACPKWKLFRPWFKIIPSGNIG